MFGWSIRERLQLLIVSTHQMQKQLDRIERQLINLNAREMTIMATLDDVKQQVSDEGTVVGSAVTLLTELKSKLDEALAAGDLGKVQEISDAIGAQKQQLADAVAANTPAG